jgi:phage terminase large subunit-like protein
MTTIPNIDKYVSDILTNKIEVCGWVKKAVERHIRDLNAQKNDDFPYYFEPLAAIHIFEFFGHLRHYKGKWAGEVVTLEPWQQFIIGSLFGWLRKDNKKRRFREGLVVVPRKNGKTLITAGIGIYLMEQDEEAGAEVYSAATARDQSKLLWNDAKQMIQRSPYLRERFNITDGQPTISNQKMASIFKPLSKDYGRLDGLNTHGALMDEIHAWKDRQLYDVLDTSTGAREQPLLLSITTAGVVYDGIATELLSYSEKILDQIIEDDRFFCINYTIDEEDKEHWNQERVLKKANPNFGVSINPEDLESLITKAEQSIPKKNDFLTKRLNVWVKSLGGWIDADRVSRCKNTKLELEEAHGKEVYMALDLASKKDLCALIVMWVDEKGKKYFKGISYMPDDQIKHKEARVRANLIQWEEEGVLTTTPGEIVDYNVIYEDIVQLCKKCTVKGIAYDPFQATQMVGALSNLGLNVIEVAQTVKNLSEPMKQMEADILTEEFQFNDNLLSWAISNVKVRRDKKENYFPGKENEQDRIDPAVACIMAYALHLEDPLLHQQPIKRLRIWS